MFSMKQQLLLPSCHPCCYGGFVCVPVQGWWFSSTPTAGAVSAVPLIGLWKQSDVLESLRVTITSGTFSSKLMKIPLSQRRLNDKESSKIILAGICQPLCWSSFSWFPQGNWLQHSEKKNTWSKVKFKSLSTQIIICHTLYLHVCVVKYSKLLKIWFPRPE